MSTEGQINMQLLQAEEKSYCDVPSLQITHDFLCTCFKDSFWTLLDIS